MHCAAALYLLADPGGVVAEIGRALRPGGRFVGMTIVSPVPPRTAPGRAVERTVSTLTGLRYLGAEELRAMCTAAGLEGFRSERRGAALLFSAQRLG